MSNFYKVLFTLSIMLCVVGSYAQTGDDLWNAYKANPDNHPNIPNCSYAGYRTGNVPLPNPSSTVYNVKNAPYNAAGNGTTDDAPAIQAAIDAAGAAGGGIVSIPAGTYLLNNFLHIKYSNVVLRGAGRDLTTLDFAKSLQNIKGDLITNGADYNWWWSGGLIWIGPANTFDETGKVVIPNTQIQAWEYWRDGSVITTVSGTATRGAKTITVASASGLSAGMKVLLTWENPSDKSLLKHVYGHVPTEGGIDSGSGGVGDCAAILPPSYPRFQWAVEIESVSGNQVTLVQPIRLDIGTNWNVRFEQTGSVITESGVEELRIKGHAQLTHTHLTKPTALVGGWNGLYINRSWNCWTKNVAVTSMENGVILACSKNVTVTGILIDGQEQNHHSFACRVNSHDNLFQDFTVNGPKRVRHGINTEWFSSGNVWSRGLQKAGTFDSHRALSFDLIRTECTVANDNGSVPGGGGSAGPYIGRRAVIWNVLEFIDSSYPLQDGSSRNGEDIHEPKQYVMGALVGVRGKPLNTTEGESMPLGDKGTIVADDDIVPSIVNLYEAQKNFRAGGVTLPSNPTVSITSPANNATFTAASNITINASASDADGTITKVEFYQGSTKLGEDTSSPYSYTWNSVLTGTYSLTAVATDDSGASTTSSSVSITVSAASNGYAIPGKVEAENYSAMNGIQTEGTSDTGGGLNVGYIDTGDWMDYSVNVSAAGTYTINYRVASQAGGGKITLRKGTTDYHTVDVPSTGGWQTWTTVSASATLDAGTQTLRIYAAASGFNLNWFEGVAGSTSTLRDPENPANAVNGLDYSYYQGNWSVLPDFSALTAAKTGTVTTFDLTPRTQNDQFAFQYTGYINVATDGTYTFYTTSDDGSKLYIGTTQVVNNDGLHGNVEASGTIGLKAGNHAITVTFFEQGGAESLSVSYAGPSLSKTVIPASELYRVSGGSAPATVVYAINAGGSAFTATDGTVYSADTKFTGGSTFSTTNTISNTTDGTLYQSERYGTFSYALPVTTSGNYNVTFKFAENYFNGSGRRVFNVTAEDNTIISALDIFVAAGAQYLAYDVVKTVSVTDGILNLQFTPTADQAKISALLVTSRSGDRMTTLDEESSDSEDLMVHPNPVTNTLYITAKDVKRVVLYNIQGLAVIQPTSNYHTVDISTIPAGMYLLKVETSKAVYTRKVLKQ